MLGCNSRSKAALWVTALLGLSGVFRTGGRHTGDSSEWENVLEIWHVSFDRWQTASWQVVVSPLVITVKEILVPL